MSQHMLETGLNCALPCVAGLMASLVLETLLRPRPRPPWRRPGRANLIHAGLWSLGFAFELALFRRPWLAAAVVLSFVLLLVLVNDAKYQALREPFLFQDFEYFRDALHHPRLYIPFFGLWRTLVAAGLFLSALGVALRIEPPLAGGLPLYGGIAALVAAALGALWLGRGGSPALTFTPETDLRRLGLAAFLLDYARAERAPRVPPPSPFMPLSPRTGPRPHLVAIQSESFFDPRPLYPQVRRELLAHFDALKATARWQGRLRVPAWGANTVRTEFAFLSGLNPARLGVHRFNPYRRFAGGGVRTLATQLRESGYRTLCLHPYPADFYRRDQVYPALGFDEFIDIRGFAHSPRCGPYVCDRALAATVGRLLEAADGPLFILVITMENHGPLHLERPPAGEPGVLFRQTCPAGCEELGIYLRHLANADLMVADLMATLNGLDEPAWLCWFGDHVPILGRAYATLGAPDGRTDYALWRPQDPAARGRQPRDLAVEDLGALWLDEALRRG